MTPQEAYNRGLDVAENEAIEKITHALNGEDSIPFNNPKMEEIRQRILAFEPVREIQVETPVATAKDYYTLQVLLDQPYNTSDLNSLDLKVIELLEYLKTMRKPRLKNRISLKIKTLLRELEVDFINHYDKL